MLVVVVFMMVVLVLAVSDIGMFILFLLFETVSVANCWFQLASLCSDVHQRLCHKSQGVHNTLLPWDPVK